MKRPVRVLLIPTGFGLNCEEETAPAFRMVGAEVDLVHLTDLFARRHAPHLTDYQVLAMVGGFSYGDHVAGGLVLATRIRAHLRIDLAGVPRGNGGRVLGICNGFQTLIRLGLLPGPEAGAADFVPRAALTNNDRLGYRDAWVPRRDRSRGEVASGRTVSARWTSRRATARGSSSSSRTPLLDRLEGAGQLAFRYVDAGREADRGVARNPNGSARGVAGRRRPYGQHPRPDAPPGRGPLPVAPPRLAPQARAAREGGAGRPAALQGGDHGDLTS